MFEIADKLKKTLMASDKKILVALLGANSTGKTTQARMLCTYLGNNFPELHEAYSEDSPDVVYQYTTYGDNVGMVGDATTVGVYGDVENKESIIHNSLKHLCKRCNITVSTDIDVAVIVEQVKLVIIFLQTSWESNVQRLWEKNRSKLRGSLNNRLEHFKELTFHLNESRIKTASMPRRLSKEFAEPYYVDNNKPIEVVTSNIMSVLQTYFEE